METSHDNGELARHQAMFGSVMKTMTVGLVIVVVALSLMAMFLV